PRQLGCPGCPGPQAPWALQSCKRGGSFGPGGDQGPAPHTFRATRFLSFVRQLYRYGFRKVPGRAGAAAPGDAGAWLHYTNPWFRRDRPELLLRIERRSAASRQRPAAGGDRSRCSRQLPRARPLPDGRERPHGSIFCRVTGEAGLSTS
uniref:HSF-type DNA-binding domain-containing protein n=1 Tax=Cyanistes caeruleus TaxID=156563 RepID=A0A8C0U4P8_CYACU